MNITDKGINLIKKYEGCKLKAYLCPAHVATIGWGNTAYKNGSKVKLGDTITQEQADELLLHVLNYFAKGIKEVVKKTLTDNQFNAILSFSYNLGLGNLRASTLLKKVNADPDDLSIKNEFMKWNKGGGQILPGLTKRRQEEANLYFTKS